MNKLLTFTAVITFIALAPVSGLAAVVTTGAQLSFVIITKMRGF